MLHEWRRKWNDFLAGYYETLYADCLVPSKREELLLKAREHSYRSYRLSRTP